MADRQRERKREGETGLFLELCRTDREGAGQGREEEGAKRDRAKISRYSVSNLAIWRHMKSLTKCFASNVMIMILVKTAAVESTMLRIVRNQINSRYSVSNSLNLAPHQT